MTQSVLRIFSYLPNPRVFKSLIAAQLCGVDVEVVGDKPANLGQWLWDYDAQLLPVDEQVESSPHARTGRRGFSGTLYKTDAFLAAHPFGTVPAAFSPDGQTGIFESNSILRAVARAGSAGQQLYGADAYAASRIDSFLDANLVFAREAQVYLLTIDNLTQQNFERMSSAYDFYLTGIESALTRTNFIAGDELSIADISFVCDVAQFLREGHYERKIQDAGFNLISNDMHAVFPLACRHMLRLSETVEFATHMNTYLDWYRTKLKDIAYDLG